MAKRTKETWPEGLARRFEHPDGRWHTIDVVDCRVYLAWGASERGGKGSTSTRDSDQDARRHALGKVRRWLKDGFVEQESKPSRRFDLEADVVEIYRSSRAAGGADRPRFDFLPVEGRSEVYLHHAPNSGMSWLVCSEDRTRAIVTRVVLFKSAMAAEERERIAEALLDELEERRDEILDDRRTPLRMLPLARTVGRFSHLLVLSPAAHEHRWYPQLGRSIWKAFPAFASEAIGDETVTVAEARTSGRAPIRSGHWDRDPHPVVDLRTLKKLPPKKSDKFLVYSPRDLPRLLGRDALAKMRGAAIEARSYRGEVRRFTKGEEVPATHLDDLRAFFGFDGGQEG